MSQWQSKPEPPRRHPLRGFRDFIPFGHRPSSLPGAQRAEQGQSAGQPCTLLQRLPRMSSPIARAWLVSLTALGPVRLRRSLRSAVVVSQEAGAGAAPFSSSSTAADMQPSQPTPLNRLSRFSMTEPATLLKPAAELPPHLMQQKKKSLASSSAQEGPSPVSTEAAPEPSSTPNVIPTKLSGAVSTLVRGSAGSDVADGSSESSISSISDATNKQPPSSAEKASVAQIDAASAASSAAGQPTGRAERPVALRLVRQLGRSSLSTRRPTKSPTSGGFGLQFRPPSNSNEMLLSKDAQNQSESQ